MNEQQLEDEILGEDVRIKPDERAVRDKFRQWIEPILAVLVGLLTVAVVVVVVLVLDLRERQSAEGVERAKGTANVCRLLNGLGLDAESDPNGRCSDPKVYKYWVAFKDEQTRSAVTSGDLLDLVCGLIADDPDMGKLPRQCEGRDITIPG